MQSNATVELPFDRHKAVMDITFAAWCEVNIEFVEWLLCEAVDAMFCLRYVRKICQKACQKICQKECQKICQKECQKICCFALCLHDRGWLGRAKVVVWGKMWQH